jgi:anti-sigma-K factor RskA
MSAVNEPLTEFERNARVVLEQSLARVDARTRSRLNQARHAALEAAGARRRAWWRSLTLVPTAGAAAAALLVAVLLWHRQPGGEPAVLEAQHVDDMELLADAEALELLDGWDGPFYEWAAAQTDNVQSDG